MRRPEYPTTASMINRGVFATQLEGELNLARSSTWHSRIRCILACHGPPSFHPPSGIAYIDAFDALLTMRVKSWTTSDIGGLNSGSCCTRSLRLGKQSTSCKEMSDLRKIVLPECSGWWCQQKVTMLFQNIVLEWKDRPSLLWHRYRRVEKWPIAPDAVQHVDVSWNYIPNFHVKHC